MSNELRPRLVTRSSTRLFSFESPPAFSSENSPCVLCWVNKYVPTSSSVNTCLKMFLCESFYRSPKVSKAFQGRILRLQFEFIRIPWSHGSSFKKLFTSPLRVFYIPFKSLYKTFSRLFKRPLNAFKRLLTDLQNAFKNSVNPLLKVRQDFYKSLEGLESPLKGILHTFEKLFKALWKGL